MLEHFSLEAQEYIKNPKNWPDEAFGVWQTNFGIVGFFRKQEVNKSIKLHYCDDRPGNYDLVEITRAKLFPSSDRVAALGLTIGGRAIKPIKFGSLQYQSIGRALRLNTSVEPKLPALITNGRWFPIYDTPGFESGLKRRGVSAERMVQLLMSDGGIPRPSATVIHNMFVDLTIGTQCYKWEPNEPTVISSGWMNLQQQEDSDEPADIWDAPSIDFKVRKFSLAEAKFSLAEAKLRNDIFDVYAIPAKLLQQDSIAAPVVTGSGVASPTGKFYNCSGETLRKIQTASGLQLDKWAANVVIERKHWVDKNDFWITESDKELRARVLKSLEKWDNLRYRK